MSLFAASDLLRRLESGERFLADGAVGTELIRAGIRADEIVAANREFPEQVLALHQAALMAGAQILTCNSFGHPGGETFCADLEAGIVLAEKVAIEAKTAVAVFVSLYPAELLTLGKSVFEGWTAEERDSRLLLLETATDLPSLLSALREAQEWGISHIAATCHFGPDAMMADGTSPEEAVATLAQVGVCLLGANCGSDPEAFLPLVRRMREETDLPLLMQPNAGLPVRTMDGWDYPVDPDAFARTAMSLFEAGAQIVGGCCGTRPAHIAALDILLNHPQRRV